MENLTIMGKVKKEVLCFPFPNPEPRFHPKGFTLIELLVVIATASVLLVMSTYMYMKALPMIRFQSSVQEVASVLALIRLKAANQGCQWFVEFDLDNGRWNVFDDDGYLTETGWERQLFSPLDSVHFAPLFMQNGRADANEFQWTGTLKAGCRFLNESDTGANPKPVLSVTKVIFRPDGTAVATPSNIGSTVWMASVWYRPVQAPDDSRAPSEHFEQMRVNRSGVSISPTGTILIVKDELPTPQP